MSSSKKKSLIFDIVMIVVLAVALGVSMVWSRTIELKLGLLYYVEVDDAAEADTLNGVVHTSAVGDSAELKVHFLDVGQGDCAIIQLPDGKTMIIDGGDDEKKVESNIQTFIDTKLASDFKYFDYAIMTHADSDHCGSLDYVLSKYPARVAYRPNLEATGTTAKPYLDPGKDDLSSTARSKDTLVYAEAIKAMYHVSDDLTTVVYVTDPSVEEQTITGGTGDNTYSFTFYSPTPGFNGTNWNNYSPIMILEYQGYRFAMSGDAEKTNLNDFVGRVKAAKTNGVDDKYDIFTDDYCVNVIKAGHHGSDNATTPEYLDVLTTPSGAPNVYCVISVGEGNKYDHPKQAALDMYKNIGLPEENILRTDILKSDISFTVRMSENGGYSMYYGDLRTDNPNNPDDPPDNPDTPDNPDGTDKPTEVEEKKQILVYKKLGSIELKWAVVGWTAYAVIVLGGIIHMLIVLNGSDSDKGSKRKGSGGRRK